MCTLLLAKSKHFFNDQHLWIKEKKMEKSSPSIYRDVHALLHVPHVTPTRTLSISGLKSRVLKLSLLSLKMMVKSGLEFVLKFTEPLQRYLLSCHANSAIPGRYFCIGQQQLWRGSVNFKIKNSRPIFTIIFKSKMSISRLIEWVLAGVYTYRMKNAMKLAGFFLIYHLSNK